MAQLKVWLPYIQGGSGADVFTRSLGEGLRKVGHEAVVQRFAHGWQYCPWGLGGVRAPIGTDVVLGNSWSGFVFKRKGIPLVTVEHLFVLDPAYRPYKTFVQNAFHATLVALFERSSMRASDVQVAVSNYTAEVHRSVMAGPRPQTILNGVDTDFYSPGVDWNHRKPDVDPIRLLYVGNLSRRKGVDMLPGIMAQLGDGYLLEYTVGLRTDDLLVGVPGAHSLGCLNHEQVRAAYRRADLLVFPTRLEGLPLVAMEAMACGTPVVASDVASLREVVEHDRTGKLCPVDDRSAFTEAIRALSYDREHLLGLGRAARQVATERFSRDRMVADYCKLLSELTN